MFDEFQRTICAQCVRKIPIVLCSTAVAEHHLADLGENGVAAVQLRPPRPSRLYQALERLAGGRSNPRAAPPARSHGWPGRQALVVDRNPVGRLIAAQLLRRFGLSVETTDAPASQVTASIVLVDARLIGELSAHVRLNEPRARIVAITSDAAADRARAAEDGADAIIGRPMTRFELESTLERLLGPPQDLT
jgi:CheY-like chemotaxis protein